MPGAEVSKPKAGVAIPARPRRGTAEIISLSPSSRPPSPSPTRLLRGARAVIFRPSPPATQGGRARSRDWVLEFEPVGRPVLDHLMGWSGGSDPLSHVRLRFPSRESAERFARRQGLDWTVIEPAQATVRPRFSAMSGPAPTDTVSELRAQA